MMFRSSPVVAHRSQISADTGSEMNTMSDTPAPSGLPDMRDLSRLSGKLTSAENETMAVTQFHRDQTKFMHFYPMRTDLGNYGMCIPRAGIPHLIPLCITPKGGPVTEL